VVGDLGVGNGVHEIGMPNEATQYLRTFLELNELSGLREVFAAGIYIKHMIWASVTLSWEFGVLLVMDERVMIRTGRTSNVTRWGMVTDQRLGIAL
jgi:hypothetical protein